MTCSKAGCGDVAAFVLEGKWPVCAEHLSEAVEVIRGTGVATAVRIRRLTGDAA